MNFIELFLFFTCGSMDAISSQTNKKSFSNIKPNPLFTQYYRSTRCGFCNVQSNSFFGLVWLICLLSPWVRELHGNVCEWIKFKLFCCTELIFHRTKYYEIWLKMHVRDKIGDGWHSIIKTASFVFVATFGLLSKIEYILLFDIPKQLRVRGFEVRIAGH